MQIFDGRKIRDEVLAGLKDRIKKMADKPSLAVFLVGDDPVSVSYVHLKQKMSENIGARFKLYKYPTKAKTDEIARRIEELNADPNVDGIMVQIPLPAQIDREKIISSISSDKDIDGLRYCQGLKSSFEPPVVRSILAAIEKSGKKLAEENIAIIGRGFLVGEPLIRFLSRRVKSLKVADAKTIDLAAVTMSADIVITAVGRSGIIKPEMIREGVVLIDAGTSEVGGEIIGDVDPSSYYKASFYTPVPGGIGPVTVAMLLSNLTDARSKKPSRS
jgi:methylenetetrahydrofolate dehydrogenase (NADP+)/methenyltetrahydrofolate cyclohydrolase